MATSFSLRSSHRPFTQLPFTRSTISRRLLPRHVDARVPSGGKRRRNRVVARLQLEDSEGKGLVGDEGLKGEQETKEGLVFVGDMKNDAFSFNWKELPMRYKLIGTTSLAFVICNMDKVNLSIAIIPMSHQFGWNSSTAGLVQSSFFWGYALSQLPGGWLAKLFGGSKVLKVGVLAWSLATILVPFVAGYMPGLVLSRILVGIGEGVSPSAATDLIARSIPLQERSRAVAVVFGGLSVGSILGLLLAPRIIQTFGWESVFYMFGVLGIIWCLAFEFVKEGKSPIAGSKQKQSSITIPLLAYGSQTKSWNDSFRDLADSLKDVPWMLFFKSPAVWAMIYAHFCGSWGHYTCLAWLPTYFSEELNLNLTEAAWVSILPSLGSVLITSIAAPFADNLITNGVETTKVYTVLIRTYLLNTQVYFWVLQTPLALYLELLVLPSQDIYWIQHIHGVYHYLLHRFSSTCLGPLYGCFLQAVNHRVLAKNDCCTYPSLGASMTNFIRFKLQRN